MKHTRLSILLSFVLVGCNTVPDAPDFQVTVSGHYKAIADCATGKFRELPDWTRSDLDSMQRVEFSKGASGAVAGIITLEPAGPNQTKITSRVQRAIYGAGYYAAIHRPIFEGCSG